MRFKQKRSSLSAEADLTPMIDMTFLLIAFFTVLVNFSQTEQNDKVTLPISELAKPTDTPLEFPIILHLTNNGTVVLSGVETSIEAIRSRLAPELDVLRLQKKTAKDANIVIRGHRSVAGGRVQDLINRCQEIGFEKFALRVKEDL